MKSSTTNITTPTWVDRVDWKQRKVRVNLTHDQVKDSPQYDPKVPVNRNYEVALYDFYGRPYQL